MSVITNNTRVMQMALSTVGSDVFKQPITIVGAISVLLVDQIGKFAPWSR